MHGHWDKLTNLAAAIFNEAMAPKVVGIVTNLSHP